MMLKILLIIATITTSHAAPLFKCTTLNNIFDSDFVQGEELFLDIDLTEGKYQLSLYGFEGPVINLNSKSEMKKSGFFNDDTLFYLAWNEEYISAVYLGDNNWGAYLKYKRENVSSEAEFMCESQFEL